MQWSSARLDELPSDGRRILVRRHFGITSFGVNAWRGAERGDRVIDEHEELDERHEELYVVLSGRATFTLDGEVVDAPPGALFFVPPDVMRAAVAAEPETVVLVIGAEPGQPFSPSLWEEWGARDISALLEARRYGEAAARYAPLVEREPEHAGARYNLACLLARATFRQTLLGGIGEMPGDASG